MKKLLSILLIVGFLAIGVTLGYATQPTQYVINAGDARWNTKLNAGLDALWDYYGAITATVSNWTGIQSYQAATYIGTTSFSVVGDLTSKYSPGQLLLLNQGVAGLVANTVVSSSYGGGITTVIVTTANLVATLGQAQILNPTGSDVVVAADYGTDQAALEAADTVAAAAGKQLVIGRAFSITTDCTLASNIKVMPVSGGAFPIANGVTLTINGSLDAGLYQIFSCTGTGKVVFGAGAVTQVETIWWGDTPNLGTCFAALPAGGTIHVSKSYTHPAAVATIPVTTNDIQWRLVGNDRYGTVITFPATDGTNFLSAAGDTAHRVGLSIEHLTLLGNAASGNCITAAYMAEGRFRLIDVDIITWGGYGLHLTSCEGFYIDPTSYIRYCNQATGTHALYAISCTGLKLNGFFKHNTKGSVYLKTCGGVDIGARFESENSANDTKWIKLEGVSGNIHPDCESEGEGQESFVHVLGSSYGLNLSGGVYVNHNTTNDITKAPIYIEQCSGLVISGNFIKAAETQATADQPYVWMGASARNVTVGRNMFHGWNLTVPTVPFYVHPDAKNIRFPFMQEKMYQFVLENVPANATTEMYMNYVPSGAAVKYAYVPKRFYPTEITIQAKAVVTQGTMAVVFSKTGGTAALTVQLDTTHTTRWSTKQHPWTNADKTDAAGSMLTSCVASANLLPTASNEILVQIFGYEWDEYNP